MNNKNDPRRAGTELSRISFTGSEHAHTNHTLAGTGGLPTFIDASENFSSDSEVEEDSFLSQLRSRGKNATLLGDDTWYGFFQLPCLEDREKT